MRDSFYMAPTNSDGWPYIQHRGGPAGFLRVLGPHQLGFADFNLLTNTFPSYGSGVSCKPSAAACFSRFLRWRARLDGVVLKAVSSSYSVWLKIIP